ncbi:Protein of unknown function [Pyronema omphalodes CBS 100304]|uniref:Uncharacterized protein n=1 Tax=Pyronema omphalodes (strain CBS 100304) TaxID=1076935 RepID=U4LEX4_PYROM|nr:Protein of unknown function [Pyronema omphalodes CBS 100304]
MLKMEINEPQADAVFLKESIVKPERGVLGVRVTCIASFVPILYLAVRNKNEDVLCTHLCGFFLKRMKRC